MTITANQLLLTHDRLMFRIYKTGTCIVCGKKGGRKPGQEMVARCVSGKYYICQDCAETGDYCYVCGSGLSPDELRAHSCVCTPCQRNFIDMEADRIINVVQNFRNDLLGRLICPKCKKTRSPEEPEFEYHRWCPTCRAVSADLGAMSATRREATYSAEQRMLKSGSTSVVVRHTGRGWKPVNLTPTKKG